MRATDAPLSLSFVIPVLNEATTLPGVLGRLRGDFPDAQIVVVDGGSGDASVSCALDGADLVLTSQPGRATQMNIGAAAAHADVLCFLHADTEPVFTQHELSACLNAGLDWGFCRVTLRSDSALLKLVGAAVNLRSRLTKVATGDQLFIVRKALFDAVGGFASIPLMEDVELSKRLRGRAKARALRLRVTTSARRWESNGVVKTIAQMWLLRLAYWAGASPERLWSHYYGSDLRRGSSAR